VTEPAASNTAIKLNILIRSVTIMLGLTAIGFVSNAIPSPKAIIGITSIMTLVPAVACLLAAVIYYAGSMLSQRSIGPKP
jgi:Na+/melibiose symporter-like transporter